MSDLNDEVFIKLFLAACEKGFGHPVTSSLSETDSKLLSNKILEQTGLMIGVKSIKNYSQYIFKEGKKENPSVATMDTFARYVLNAPYTDEVRRKDNEDHHPYWFEYRATFKSSTHQKIITGQKTKVALFLIVASVVIAVVIFLTTLFHKQKFAQAINEDFTNVSDDSLKTHGWSVRSTDPILWNKKDSIPGHLSLFTLNGDNWSDDSKAVIKNLLFREINFDCFTTEVHISNFFPQHNWQQAGIILSEDSTFKGKMIRLSISYNDFFGGYERSPEIIIQGVSSVESNSASKPEEFTHTLLYTIDPGKEELVRHNLISSTIKIEKSGNHFRFLYNTGPEELFAFKEVTSREFSINPRYIALFAIQGLTTEENVMPVFIDSFQIAGMSCEK